MIADIHHHIVYGVDDGSKNMEMSQAMLKKAVENGVEVICCTSHATPGHKPFPWDDYLAHLEEMGEYIVRENLPITLLPGCEILYTQNSATMARKGDVPTMAGRRFALVEFLPIADWQTIQNAAREFAYAGLQMVCAHVERYNCLREDMDHLYELHDDLGVICQMNCSTVIRSHGMLGDKWAKKVLKAGLIDVAASDAHNVSERACNISACREALTKNYGEDVARAMLEDMPWHILFE